MRLKRTPEYIEWYESQRPKEKAQVAKRLTNIEEHGHFGTVKDLGDFLSEAKMGQWPTSLLFDYGR